jgi:uncharacterized protein (DUF488 family)
VANPGDAAPVVYTVGYEQHRRPEDLAEVLRHAQIERLVDVRELPLSRRPGFSKAALENALAEAGIAYEHARALGNPKRYRDLYKAGRKAEGERGYRAHIRNESEAVGELLAALAAARTCVMCVERNPADCHRSILVEELRAREPRLQVEHL